MYLLGINSYFIIPLHVIARTRYLFKNNVKKKKNKGKSCDHTRKFSFLTKRKKTLDKAFLYEFIITTVTRREFLNFKSYVHE